jgi:hypothetical protein
MQRDGARSPTRSERYNGIRVNEREVRANQRAAEGERPSQNERTHGHPNLSNNQENTGPPAHAMGSARCGFATNARKAWNDEPFLWPTSYADVKTPDPPPVCEPDARWTRICAVLALELGEPTYKRFFSATEFEEIVDGVVRLRTPAPYDARKIKEQYEDVLLRLWRSEDESLQSIQILHGRRWRRTGT